MQYSECKVTIIDERSGCILADYRLISQILLTKTRQLAQHNELIPLLKKKLTIISIDFALSYWQVAWIIDEFIENQEKWSKSHTFTRKNLNKFLVSFQNIKTLCNTEWCLFRYQFYSKCIIPTLWNISILVID